jgi:hypothetical protein
VLGVVLGDCSTAKGGFDERGVMVKGIFVFQGELMRCMGCMEGRVLVLALLTFLAVSEAFGGF